jgi:iron complex outermembrane receptor protein
MPRGIPMSMKIVLSILLAGIIILDSEAQTVTGRVIDSESAEALIGANVVTTSGPTKLGTATSADGRFTLPRLISGRYTLQVSYVGYRSQDIVVDVREDGRHDVEILLVPTDIEINPVTITASRSPQKLLDAPAAITVLETEEIEARTALTAAEYLKAVPSVDLISTGINQSRIVIRGFNDNLASSLLTLVDYRIARIPSIRLTALNLIPINSADIERIEVVSGPASALYGPNAANGVVHIVTRSPFDSRGTTATVSMGENEVLSGALRHAGTVGNRLGFKVFAQYYTGRDFEFADSLEVSARRLALEAGADEDTLRIGLRDFNVRNLALDGRVDYRFSPTGTLIVSGGLTHGDNIETSPTGAVQAKNALYTYAQARLRYGRLFAQVFYSELDSRDSYALRTGDLFSENSGQFVAQAQHNSSIGQRQDFTYGVDLYLTRPDSKGTVNGAYEDQDDINEVGAYVQSETRVSRKLDVVLAARVDRHNRVDDLTFSPRAALVVKPTPQHTFRVTFNRAFQTPAANHLFADVLGQRDVFEGARLEPLLGFSPAMNLRAQGTPSNGFHFSRDMSGRVQFRSPYARLDPRGFGEDQFISLDDPVFTNVMWSVARDASVAGLGLGLAESGLIPTDQLEAFSNALDLVLPDEVVGVRNSVQILDLGRQGFVPTFEPSDIGPLKITRTETIEFGYKGVLRERVFVGLDVYRTHVKNFIGPFLVGSPTVFLDSPTLQVALTEHVEQVLADPANADALSSLLALDRIQGIGNGDGSPASELSFLISSGIAGSVPFGSVNPVESFDPTAALLVRRNFGDISLYGADVYFTYLLSPHWSFGGTYSFVSENLFRNVDNINDIALNAPRNKVSGSVRFTYPRYDLRSEIRVRYVGGFPVRSDVYVGTVNPYTLVDLSMHYRVPFSPKTQLTVTIQNLLNNEHEEFVDVPKLGRLALVRLAHTF